MKAISILQPWASLCVHTDENGKALKQIETRSWNTKYRGELLIHASKGKVLPRNIPFDTWKYMEKHSLCTLVGHSIYTKDLPLGAIIGKVDLVHTISTNQIRVDAGIHLEENGNRLGTWNFTDTELLFGDYSPNRFGWLLDNPVLFKEPIPCKGQLSIWNVPAELEPLVTKQLTLQHGRIL